MPLEVVQEFLGHTDISTTRNIYAPVLGVQVVSEWLDNVDVAPESVNSKQ
jgi:site-specific recombinase XerD